MQQSHFLVASVLVSAVLGCAPDHGDSESSLDDEPAHIQERLLHPKPSPEVLEKRVEYRDALRRVVEILERRYMEGTDTFTSLAEASIELAEAELAAGRSQDERIAALEILLDCAKKREDYAREQMEFGTGRADEMAIATAGRLHAELMLLEERRKLDPVVSEEKLK